MALIGYWLIRSELRRDSPRIGSLLGIMAFEVIPISAIFAHELSANKEMTKWEMPKEGDLALDVCVAGDNNCIGSAKYYGKEVDFEFCRSKHFEKAIDLGVTKELQRIDAWRLKGISKDKCAGNCLFMKSITCG